MAASSAIVVTNAAPRREEVEGTLDQLRCSYSFVTTESIPDVIERDGAPELLIMMTGRGASSELDCLRRLRAAAVGSRCLFVAANSTEELAIDAFHAGAERYLREPWTITMLRAAIEDMLPIQAQSHWGAQALAGSERLIGRSKSMQEMRQQLACISTGTSNVLVTGETGAGKELVAELIHANSSRADKPFVCINTAAMPDALVESELFGHERGAFTGAVSAQEGKLAAANGGTVFLDEIGDVPVAVQAKLLRAIENKTIYRVGSTRPLRLDVRVIAATHKNLEKAIAEGSFRKDLYYRLNVLRVQLPALRERSEDVPALVQNFIRHFNRELGRSIRGLSARALVCLRAYAWPGNVRELRNVVEAIIVNLAPETTGIVDLPPVVMRQLAAAVGAPPTERERLLQALVKTNWNKSRAAEELHCSRMTLYRRMQRHDLGQPK